MAHRVHVISRSRSRNMANIRRSSVDFVAVASVTLLSAERKRSRSGNRGRAPSGNAPQPQPPAQAQPLRDDGGVVNRKMTFTYSSTGHTEIKQ